MKYLNIYFFITFTFSSSLAYANSKVDELKLSNKTVGIFFKYISSERGPNDKFLVTTDGLGTFVWKCPQTLCFPGTQSFYTRPCSIQNNGKKCRIFATSRKIKLKNKSNKLQDFGKIRQSVSLIELKVKLKKLGFID